MKSELKSRIEKVVKRYKLSEFSQEEEDLKYWLSKTPEERVAAVEQLRRMYYGDSQAIFRIVRRVKRTQS